LRFMKHRYWGVSMLIGKVLYVQRSLFLPPEHPPIGTFAVIVILEATVRQDIACECSSHGSQHRDLSTWARPGDISNMSPCSEREVEYLPKPKPEAFFDMSLGL
jgi:hypothetical protein